jgi:hypothetical protein
MDDRPNTVDLETRIERIERRLNLAEGSEAAAPTPHPALPFLTGMAAAVTGYLGLGTPQHYYQGLFSILIVLLLYHRQLLRLASGYWKWPQILLNVVILCLLLKLFIGGGLSHPFDWFKLPAIAKVMPSGEQSWYSGVLPTYTIQWQAVLAITDWSIDITKIQTFVLLAIFAGILFHFEPFTSLAVFALLILSLPAYLRYDWDWVVPFIILCGVSIYFQARVYTPRHRE